MKTREQAIAAAGQTFAAGRRQAAAMTPEELAEAAWTPTCGKTRQQLEDEIRNQRGLPLRHAS